MQKQSFPIIDARIITRARAPGAPSHPNTNRTIMLSLLLGGALGAGIGFLRERSDREFRTGTQVREELGAEFLGMLPTARTAQPRAKSDEVGELLRPRISLHRNNALCDRQAAVEIH